MYTCYVDLTRAFVLPGDWVQLRIQLQGRERLQAAVDAVSSSGVPQQGACIGRAHVPEPIQVQAPVLDLHQQLRLELALELAQRVLMWPQPPLKGL